VPDGFGDDIARLLAFHISLQARWFKIDHGLTLGSVRMLR
jgi:hypothetical protein